MDRYLVHTGKVGIQTQMSRYSYTRACIFFFRIVLLSCRKEEHDQSGRVSSVLGAGVTVDDVLAGYLTGARGG